jgi:hypothetical protein
MKTGIPLRQVSIIFCLLTSLILVGEAAHSQAVEQQNPDAKPELIARAYKMKHMKPEDVVKKIANLIPFNAGFRVAVDTATHQLIVVSDQSGHDRVDKIISLLDIPRSKPSPIASRYELSRGTARKVFPLIKPLLLDKEKLVHMGTEPLIFTVAARPETLVEINRLVDPYKTPLPASRRLRLVWLISSNEAEELAPVPPDMKEVADELEKMGIAGLSTAAQLIVQTTGDKEFHIRGSMQLGTSTVKLQASGQFIET